MKTPEAWSARVRIQLFGRSEAEFASIALDPRVASNIRLGDDPPALPANMRAQAEPHIAHSPANADIHLATFQEGRFAAGGGAVDCGYSVSRDGGLTGTRALIPNLTGVTGGPYFRATDPVAGIASNGDLYLNTIGSTDAQFITSAVLVSRSTDGGNNFAPPVVVYQSPNDTILPDKNWMAINTFAGTPAAGRIMVMFARFVAANANGAPIVRSFSDDGGITWSPIAFIHPMNTDAQGAQPVYLATGRLAVVYWNFNGTANFSDDFMQVVISDDGGNTFGSPKFITNVNFYSEPAIRNGPFLPSATTDRTTGNIYLVYQGLVAGSPKILFTKSSSNGDSWTTPIPISDNPNASGVFDAAIAASDDGQTLTATFYDHRDNPGSTTPGSYTAIVRGRDNSAGVALVELYDLEPDANSRLANISSRSFVQTGDNVMIGGFIVGHGSGPNGTRTVRVVVRGIGPSLTARGIAGALQDPELSLFNNNGEIIASNDNWHDTRAGQIQATGLPPEDNREAAVLTTLPAGSYTALVRGKNGATGVALIESYNVQ